MSFEQEGTIEDTKAEEVDPKCRLRTKSARVIRQGLISNFLNKINDQTTERENARSRSIDHLQSQSNLNAVVKADCISGSSLAIQSPYRIHGLRYFSSKVCENVRTQVVTTFNKVTEDLMRDYFANDAEINKQDAYNVRRRVYDAINVLLALKLITKDKGKIRWLGFPSDIPNQSCIFEQKRRETNQRVRQKCTVLKNLLIYHICLQQLIVRNIKRDRAARTINAKSGSTPNEPLETVFYQNNSSVVLLPFIVASCSKDTQISVHASANSFEFDQPFFVRSDEDILKELGMPNKLSIGRSMKMRSLAVNRQIPSKFKGYLTQLGKSNFLRPLFYINKKNKRGKKTLV